MASLSCRISPRTSTVIFFDRSPLATAMVTSAMFRTCAVRLDAIEFTLSVRSFQTPVTSGTCAWPPSLPSVPTSRATRVTSDVNTPSCLIMVLTMVAERRNSPCSGRPSTSSCTVCSRSPCATAAIARVTSVVGQSRSSIRVLIEPSISTQAPLCRPSRTRCLVLPSLPTRCPTRSSCCAMRWLAATISLNVSAILPSMPSAAPGSRTEKSPTRIACSAASNSCGWKPAPLPFTSGLGTVVAPFALGCALVPAVGCMVGSQGVRDRLRLKRIPQANVWRVNGNRRESSAGRVPADATRVTGELQQTMKPPWAWLTAFIPPVETTTQSSMLRKPDRFPASAKIVARPSRWLLVSRTD